MGGGGALSSRPPTLLLLLDDAAAAAAAAEEDMLPGRGEKEPGARWVRFGCIMAAVGVRGYCGFPVGARGNLLHLGPQQMRR